MTEVVKLADFEAIARDVLDPAAFDYYAGGAGDEWTLAENVAAFGRRRLRPRMLVDVSTIDTTTEFLGVPVAAPFGISPTALHGLADPEGEVATARAAANAGVMFCLSTFSSRSLEEVATAPPGPRWFQLYVHKDRGISKTMIERAATAGYHAIVLTVDLPVTGYRERELRNGLVLKPDAFGNLREFHTGDADLLGAINAVTNPSITWDDLEWIRSASDLPVLVKGILTGEDAVLAVEHGAAAVVVSNHGGRQLDRVPGAIDVLEEVVDAVQGRVEVYLDGGVRRGTDVVVALALGARGAFCGRPYLYALAAAGEEGVVRAIGLLTAEVANAMALVGTPSVDAITRDRVS